MPQDFIIVPSTATIPTDKAEQIALILHQSVYDALYRVFQSSAPLMRLADYSHFFTVTFDDLAAYLHAHPDEFHALLPADSGDGISVIRDGTHYSFRDHYRGLVTHSESVEGIDAAVARWLRWHLLNQGLRRLYDHVA
jgi:hypothetical protein